MKVPLCDCDIMNVTIIAQGDGLNHATITWCEKHGKLTTCYMCDPKNKTTELCPKHLAIFLERIMNRFGYYRLPRYWIWKVKDDGTETRFMYGYRRTVYSYYDMLDFTAVLNNCTTKGIPIKYRVERIEKP
jgi:hypothetical protein